MSFENDIKACISVMENGGLILYPTDTVWGIGCDATNEDAVAKIFRLKQRSDEKSMVILVADEKTILEYVTQPHLEVFDYIKGISKPTTVIYNGAVGLADNVIAKDRSVAIRITRDDFCRHLIKRYRKPIVSTSANISGYPAPALFMDIDIKIKEGVDYTVQHRQDDETPAVPSSILKWGDDGSLTIIRP